MNEAHPKDGRGRDRADGPSRPPETEDPVLAVCVAILDAEQRSHGHVSDLIAGAFRRQRELTAEERGRAARWVYGVLRSQRLLDHLLVRCGDGPLPDETRSLGLLLAKAVLEGSIRFRDARAVLPQIRWNQIPAAMQEAGQISDPVARLALLESLPDWLAQRLVVDFGEEHAASLAHALNEAPPLTIRVNRLRTDRAGLADRLAQSGLDIRETELAPDGLILSGHHDLFRRPEFREGWFELQDEGSQLVSELVAPPPGGRVLDACAGSGGKTLHLGALLQGKGRIAAVGVGPSAVRQLGELRRRCERAGLHNVQVFWIDEGDRVSGYDEVDDPVVRAEDGSTVVDDPRVRAEDESTVVDDPSEVVTRDVGRTDEAETARWPASLPTWLGKTDRVLIDAPCSGLGVLRRNPDTRFRLTPETIPRLAALQLSILERFAPFVKPGGRLVYATCSVLHEENDAVVASFLGGHPEFTVMPAKEILGKPRALRIGDGTVLRLNPAEHGTDGFFAVVLRRG